MSDDQTKEYRARLIDSCAADGWHMTSLQWALLIVALVKVM